MNIPKNFMSALILLAISLATGQTALADAIGYNSVVDIRAESNQLVALHHHDWRGVTYDSKWRNPFSADNTYSHLRLLEKETGKELFTLPVPALTFLWISPDSRYVVGVSTVKLRNPCQLVVFSRSGKRLFEKAIHPMFWSGASESVTNWVYWFREPQPNISIHEQRTWYGRHRLVLTIEGNSGVNRVFNFSPNE